MKEVTAIMFQKLEPGFTLLYFGKNKRNDNFKTSIPSKNYDRPNTTKECGIF